MAKNKHAKKLAVLAATVLLAAVSMVSPFTNSYAVYNDEKYDSYVNMKQTNDSDHAKYIIPNLYRQDAAYTNVKTFPLVVNNSVEYFPLDIFALYQYLEVVYSKVAYGFYINNTKNNHYVAFDLETGITTTHDNQNLEIQAKIFHRTHYVPAKTVCEVLGMTFETYDDEKNGIRAARISDSKAKSTLEELVVAYSPIKKDPVVDNYPQTDPKPDITTPPDSETTVTVNPPPAVGDPYKNVGTRNIYLTFESCPDSKNTKAILDVLEKHGKTAIFFLEEDKILKYPDTVRQIVAAGHSTGLFFSPQASNREVFPNEHLENMLIQANDALYLVAKTKARYIRASYGFAEQLTLNGFSDYAESKGYAVYDWNINSADYNGRPSTAFEQIKKDIVGNNSKAARTVFIRFGSYKATAETLDKLLDFCKNYPQFRIMTTDEYTNTPSFT